MLFLSYHLTYLTLHICMCYCIYSALTYLILRICMLLHIFRIHLICFDMFWFSLLLWASHDLIILWFSHDLPILFQNPVLLLECNLFTTFLFFYCFSILWFPLSSWQIFFCLSLIWENINQKPPVWVSFLYGFHLCTSFIFLRLYIRESMFRTWNNAAWNNDSPVFPNSVSGYGFCFWLSEFSFPDCLFRIFRIFSSGSSGFSFSDFPFSFSGTLNSLIFFYHCTFQYLI